MDLTLGTVKENYDKDHPGMVQVILPDFAKDGGETAWLPVASSYAGKGYGAYILPEKDDQVIVGFLNGDPQSGIVLGSLWNKKNTLPPEAATEKNEVRAFVTKGGHTISVKDGEEGGISVKTKAGHTIVIDEKAKKITIATNGGKQKIELDEGGGEILVEADKKISLKAKDIALDGKLTAKGQAISIESSGNLDIKGKQIKIDGSTAKLNSQNTEVTGAMVKVESSGILTLKGSMTKIN
jgi:uncharacterized protein involved in type VI secretion and phage assembly